MDFKWALTIEYFNSLGDKVTSYLPLFDSYAQCMAWKDIIYLHILQYNNVTDFVYSCDWIRMS